MDWVYFAIAVGLVGFLIQMGVRYRGQSVVARTRAEAARLAIAKTERRIGKVQAKIDAAQTNINTVKEEKESLEGDVKQARASLKELEEKEARRRPTRSGVDRDQAEP